MKIAKYISYLLVLVAVQACNPNLVRNHQIDNARQLSYQEVSSYAYETERHIKTYSEERTKGAALDSVKSKLKDPESAMFRNVRLVKYDIGHVYCGEVNAKNSYGGYTGFSMFVAGPNSAMIHSETFRNGSLEEAERAGVYDACVGR